MWRILNGAERKKAIADAADLMKRPADFERAMLRAIEAWPNSCRASLTIPAINRIAWLGHAGCCIAIQSPEECTRIAWHTLSPSEQDAANEAAARALATYRAPAGRNAQRDLFENLQC